MMKEPEEAFHTRPPQGDSSGLLWLSVMAVIAVAVVYFVVVTRFVPESDRGSFGDMFGALTSVFSGLAFAGLIYTIDLQRRELRLQRIELAATRAEMKASRKEQARSADAQNELVDMQLLSARIQGLSAVIAGRYQYASAKEGVQAKDVVTNSIRAEEETLVKWMQQAGANDLALRQIKR